jgi:tetratricopeptide (TPR) repeat protein
MFWAIFDFLGVTSLAQKLVEVAANYVYHEALKSRVFYKALSDLRIKPLADEFENIYMHSIFAFSSQHKSEDFLQEFVKLLLVKNVKDAFSEQIRSSTKENKAFSKALNDELHTNRLVRKLKKWNEIPEEYTTDFYNIYNLLVKEAATPVLTEIRVQQEQFFSDINVQYININQSISQLNKDFQSYKSEMFFKADISSVVQEQYQKRIATFKGMLDRGLVEQAKKELLNFKREEWEKASPKVRFNILTNLGVCYQNLGDSDKAIHYMIEAYQYDPKSQSALNNIINVYYALNDITKAQYYLDYFFELYPDASDAYACKIRLQPDMEAVNQVAKTLPPFLIDNKSVLLSLGIAANKFKDYDKSFSYFERLCLLYPDYIQAKEYYLSALLGKYTSNFRVFNLSQINTQVQKELDKAISLIDSLSKHYEFSERSDLRSQLHKNKAVVLYAMDRLDEAIFHIEKALDYKPNDAQLLKFKSMFWAVSGNSDKAIAIMEMVSDFSVAPDIPCVLSHYYKVAGKYDKAVSILENYIANYSDEEYLKLAKNQLLRLYIESNDQDQVLRLISKESQGDTTYDLLNQAIAAKYFGNEHEAKEILQEAKSAILPGTHLRELYLLGEELINFKLFQDAIDVFIQFVDFDVNDELILKMAKLYFNTGNRAESLSILQNFRRLHGIQKEAVQFEVLVSMKMNELENARAVIIDYLKIFPNDVHHKLKFHLIKVQLEEYELLEEFLAEEVDIFLFDFIEIRRYLQLLKLGNKEDKYFHVAYEYFRNKKQGLHSCIFYTGALLFYPYKGQSKNPHQVKVNTVVKMEDTNKKSFHLVVEDRAEAELFGNEINTHDEKFKILQGKKVGDIIEFKNSTLPWKITGLKHKYIFALHDSIEKLRTVYQGQHDFMIQTLREDFQQEALIQAWVTDYDLAKKAYKTRKIPLAAVGYHHDKNLIELWFEFRAIKNLGIQSTTGAVEDKQIAEEALSRNNTIYADITGLLTVFELDIGDAILRQYGKIRVASATYNLVAELIDRYSPLSPYLERSGISLDQLLDFVNQYTVQEAPINQYDLELYEMEEILSIIGLSSFDTLLLLLENEGVFLCEDMFLRRFMYVNFDIKGIWTQVLVKSLFPEGQEYYQLSLTLAGFNFNFVSLDNLVLEMAAYQAGFKYQAPLASCLKYLGGGRTTEETGVRQNALIVLSNQILNLLPFIAFLSYS